MRDFSHLKHQHNPLAGWKGKIVRPENWLEEQRAVEKAIAKLPYQEADLDAPAVEARIRAEFQAAREKPKEQP